MRKQDRPCAGPHADHIMTINAKLLTAAAAAFIGAAVLTGCNEAPAPEPAPEPAAQTQPAPAQSQPAQEAQAPQAEQAQPAAPEQAPEQAPAADAKK